MKKAIMIFLILVLAIDLIGCDNKFTEGAEEGIDCNFEYKFKEEYSDKINSKMAEQFIDFTKDTLTIYIIGFEDFDSTSERGLSNHMGKAILNYDKIFDTLNEEIGRAHV